MRTIRIQAGTVSCQAELSTSRCAQAIWDALPLQCEVHTWGDEIYCYIPIAYQRDETAREAVEKGDLGYWPEGPAFCIFFGPTPISRGDEIRPASAVNVVGRITGDPAVFRSVKPGARIIIEKREDE